MARRRPKQEDEAPPALPTEVLAPAGTRLAPLADAEPDPYAAEQDRPLVGPPLPPRNPWISREAVSAWSEQIDRDEKGRETAALRALFPSQPHLVRFVQRNTGPNVASRKASLVAQHNLGAVLRIFELAGGSVAMVEPELLAAAEAHVQACLKESVTYTWQDGTEATEPLLPLDRHFPRRARRFQRRQPSLLDELLAVQFERGKESVITGKEKVAIYLLLWVVVHAIDLAWTAPAASVAMADTIVPTGGGAGEDRGAAHSWLNERRSQALGPRPAHGSPLAESTGSTVVP